MKNDATVTNKKDVIIDMIIFLGISAIFLFSVMKLKVSGREKSVKIQTALDAIYIEREIANYLRDPEKCKFVFSGKNSISDTTVKSIGDFVSSKSGTSNLLIDHFKIDASNVAIKDISIRTELFIHFQINSAFDKKKLVKKIDLEITKSGSEIVGCKSIEKHSGLANAFFGF